MNKSIVNKVLIFVVVTVWGLIIYKYWFPSSSDEVHSNHMNFNGNIYKPKKIKEVSIVLLERDPFLAKKKKHKKKKEESYKKRVVKKTKQKQKKDDFIWPKIKYLGFLKKQNEPKKILLMINGTFKNLNENEKILKKITIDKVYKDSIIIQGKKSSKTIKKGV